MLSLILGVWGGSLFLAEYKEWWPGRGILYIRLSTCVQEHVNMPMLPLNLAKTDRYRHNHDISTEVHQVHLLSQDRHFLPCLL